MIRDGSPRCWVMMAALLGLSGVGCGSSDSDSDAPGGGAGGSGGAGGASGGTGGSGGAALPDGCTTLVEPSEDDTETVQTALIEADSGDTVCLGPGTYSFTRELSLSDAQDVTFKGTGDSREDVVLDFAEQTVGDDGVTVTADGFTIENLWVKNSSGNGVVVRADDSTFRNLKVTWDAGSVTENGAYAVYPTNCAGTLIEDTEVVGASDAGIYVGQCTDAIVRNNVVHGNVAGLEVENTTRADVYGNTVYNNSAGIFVLLLPNKEKKDAGDALIRDNEVYDNNHENFGLEGTTVSVVPPGTGMILIGASDTEVRNNTFRDNGGTGIVIVSYDIIAALQGGGGADDPETDKYPKRQYIHDNTYEGNGTDLQDVYPLLAAGATTLPDVLWDGFIDPDVADAAGMEICLGETEQATFLNFAAADGFDAAAQSTDPTPHQCTLDPIPEL